MTPVPLRAHILDPHRMVDPDSFRLCYKPLETEPPDSQRIYPIKHFGDGELVRAIEGRADITALLADYLICEACLTIAMKLWSEGSRLEWKQLIEEEDDD